MYEIKTTSSPPSHSFSPSGTPVVLASSYAEIILKIIYKQILRWIFSSDRNFFVNVLLNKQNNNKTLVFFCFGKQRDCFRCLCIIIWIFRDLFIVTFMLVEIENYFKQLIKKKNFGWLPCLRSKYLIYIENISQ